MVMILRLLVFSLFIFSGFFIGRIYDAVPVGIGIALLTGTIALLFERLFRTVAVGKIIGGVAGLSIGIIFTNLLLFPLRMIVPN